MMSFHKLEPKKYKIEIDLNQERDITEEMTLSPARVQAHTRFRHKKVAEPSITSVVNPSSGD